MTTASPAVTVNKDTLNAIFCASVINILKRHHFVKNITVTVLLKDSLLQFIVLFGIK